MAGFLSRWIKGPLAAATIALGLGGAATPAHAFLNSEEAWNDLLQFAVRQINAPGEFEIDLGRVTQPEDGFALISTLQIKDADGVWLDAEDLLVDWQPTSLLRGRFVFDTLSAKRIQLLRTPIGRGDPPAEEAQIDFAWPRPPVTMIVEKMLIERMIIEGGILPQDIEARIEGRFSDDDDIQESTLGVTRLDRPGDSINLGTRINFDEMDISFSLEAAEAPGGLVGELAGLPETEALEITAAAAGNPAALPFTLYADIGQIGIAEGEGVASWQDRIAATFNGAVIPGEKTSGAWRQALGDQAKIGLDVVQTADGGYQLNEFTIDSNAFAMNGKGDVDPTANTIDLAFDWAAGDIDALNAVIAPASIGAVNGTATAVGALNAPKVDVDAAVRGLDASFGTVDAFNLLINSQPQQDTASQTQRFSFEVAAQGLGLKDAALQDALGADPSLRGNGAFYGAQNRVAVEALEVRAATLDLDGNANYDLTSSALDAELSGAARRLGPFLRAAGLPVDGAANLALKIQGLTAESVERLFLNAQLSQLSSEDPTYAALIGDDATLEALLVESTPGIVNVERGFFESATLRADASGQFSVPNDTVDVELDFALNDGARLAPVIAPATLGGADGTAVLQGTLSEPKIDLRLTAEEAGYEGYAAARADVTGSLQMRKDLRAPFSMNVAIDGFDAPDPTLAALVGDAPRIEATGIYDTATTLTILENSRAEIAAGVLTLQGNVNIAKQTLDATYALDSRDLGAIGQAAGVDMSGTVDAEGSVSGAFSEPLVSTRADVRDLRLYGYAVESMDLDLSTEPANEDGDVPFALDLTAVNPSLNDPDLDALIGTNPSVKASGTINPQKRRASLTSFATSLSEIDATANGDVDLLNSTLDLNFDLDARDLGGLGTLLGTDTGGAIKASGSAAGSFFAPELDIDLNGQDLRYDAYRVGEISGRIDMQQTLTGFAPFDIDVTASGVDLGDPNLNALVGPRASVVAKGSFNQRNRALTLENARFDLAAAKGTAAGSIDLTGQTVDMTYDVEVGALEPIGTIAGIDLGGSVTAKGSAAGAFTAPRIDTSIRGRNLRYDAYSVAAIDGTINVDQAARGFAPFKVDIDATGIDLGDPALTDLVGGSARIDAAGDYDQSQRLLRIGNATVIAADATVSTKGLVDIEARSLDLTFALDAKSLAGLEPVLDTPISGALTAAGSARGMFTEPAIAVKIDGDALRYDAYRVGKIEGDIAVDMKSLGPSPFDIDVRASGLDLGDAELNRALGSTANIAARGSYDQAAQFLALESARVVSNAATISAQGDVNLRDGELDVSYAIDANDLSPFSGLAGNQLGGALDSNGRISGAFTAPEIDGRVNGLSLRYGDYSIARIDGLIDIAQNPNGPAPFNIDVTASGFDLGDPNLTAALGPSVKVRADGAFDQSAQRLRLRSATVVADPATVTASGSVDLAAQTLDISYDLDARNLGAFAPVIGADLAGSLAAKGRAQGPFVIPAVETTLTGRGLRYGAYSIGAIDGRLDIPASTAGLAPFSLDITANGIGSGDANLDALIGGGALLRAEGRIDTEAQVIDLASAQVSTRAANVAARGRIDLGAQILDVTFSLDARDLSPASGLAGQSVGGALRANGSARGAFAAPIVNLDATGNGLYYGQYSVGQLDLDLSMQGQSGGIAPFTLTASAFGTRIGDPNIEALLGQTVTLDARGSLDQGRLFLRLDDATLRAAVGAARVAGLVDIQGQELDAGYSVHIPSLGALQPVVGQTIAGEVRADGRILGPFADPQTSGEVAGFGVVFQTYDLTSLNARYDVQNLITGPNGAASLNAETDQGPLDASVAFDLSGGGVRISQLSVNGLGLAVQGQVETLPGGLYAGNVSFEALELSTLGRFIEQDIAGTASGRIDLDAADGRQNARFDIDASDLRYAGLARVGTIYIEGSASDALGRDPNIDATAFAASAVVSGYPVSQINVTARGPLSALEATLDGNGGETGSDKLQTAMRLNIINPPRSAVFYRLAASYQGIGISSASQFTIEEIPGGGVRATGLDLRVSDGEIVGSAEYTPNGLVAQLRMRNVPMQLARLAGVDLIQSGRLFGEVDVDTRGAPRGTFRFTANVLRLKGAQLDDPFDLVVEGTMDGRALNTTASVSSRLLNQPLRAVAMVPLRQVAGVPVPLPDENAPFNASVDWEGDVAEFWAFVPAPDHVLSGPVVIRGRADGTIAAPRLEGGMVLSGGRYQNLEFGTLLDQINATGDFTQDGRVVFDLNATDGVAGTLSGRGSYTVADGTLDAGIELNQAALVRRDDATAILSGQATAKSQGPDIAVTGAFQTDFVELRLIGGFGGSVVVIDAVPVGETAPIVQPVDENAKAQRIALDLRLDFPRQVFVRGRGLDSEWGGGLQVSGYASDPRINGLIERRRGILDLLGRQFELTTGEVRFNGPVSPFIRVRLSRQANEILGWLDIVGPADDIELEFGSIPALPPDEVLPRLLFGRSKQSLSALEAAQLAAGVATLLSGKAGILDEVRGALGVDVLRVEGGDGDGTSIATGKYLTEDVFVGAKQNLETGGTSAFVEIEVFENIELEGEFGADEAEASANWKLDY